jgi:dTDP-L-rhamnose 4-epimerase
VGDVRHTVSSIARLEALGWRATRSLGEIFDDYLAWLDATPDAGDYLTPAFEAMERSGVLRRVAKPVGAAARM